LSLVLSLMPLVMLGHLSCDPGLASYIFVFFLYLLVTCA